MDVAECLKQEIIQSIKVEYIRLSQLRIAELESQLAQANQLAAHWEEQAAEYKAKLLELEMQK